MQHATTIALDAVGIKFSSALNALFKNINMSFVFKNESNKSTSQSDINLFTFWNKQKKYMLKEFIFKDDVWYMPVYNTSMQIKYKDQVITTEMMILLNTLKHFYAVFNQLKTYDLSSTPTFISILQKDVIQIEQCLSAFKDQDLIKVKQAVTAVKELMLAIALFYHNSWAQCIDELKQSH